MSSFGTKCIVFISLALLTGCDIAFKRKSESNPDYQAEMRKQISEDEINDKKTNSNKSEPVKARAIFSQRDTKLIKLYYGDVNKSSMLRDMVKHTWVTEKQAKTLTVTARISNDIQVVPLPLELEKLLSLLPRYSIRVQVGKNVIIMDIKSRRIIDIVKL